MELDGNGHYWPAQPPAVPPSFYAMPNDPLVSPDYNGWWQRGLHLLRQTWKPSLILHVIVAVPTVAMMIPAQRRAEEQQAAAERGFGAVDSATVEMGPFLIALGLVLVVALISALIYMVVTVAAARMVVLAATGQPVTLASAVRTGLRRAPAMLGWGLLAIPIYLVAALLCFFPVLYVGAALAVLPVVITVERGAGIGRSFQLFHADFGAALARIATLGGIGLAFGLVYTVITAILQAALPDLAATVAIAFGDGIVYALGGVLFTPFLVAAYADMRARREPFSTAYLMTPPT
ncbi:hypothetical protein [Actinoplanes rectilineatus]|uniref:hypothetical protein n=1 Tax=Actinoplanes rectilineatus TaxID=113571 RepID=UPI000A613692|nr:hypothetical protein [Actinoplanes rectilineatus]